MNSYIPTLDDVLVAHERIAPHMHRTPGSDLFAS
jgi:threonine dehydratase